MLEYPGEGESSSIITVIIRLGFSDENYIYQYNTRFSLYYLFIKSRLADSFRTRARITAATARSSGVFGESVWTTWLFRPRNVLPHKSGDDNPKNSRIAVFAHYTMAFSWHEYAQQSKQKSKNAWTIGLTRFLCKSYDTQTPRLRTQQRYIIT